MSLLVEHLNKRFGQVQALTDLSMDVPEGALFGFLGPNGAGKTTTMRLILDLLLPDSGQITWKGTPVRAVSRRSFGYLPEERGLYPKMAVEAQLLFLARLSGFSKHEALAALEEWLERFQITTLRRTRPEALEVQEQFQARREERTSRAKPTIVSAPLTALLGGTRTRESGRISDAI